MNTKKTLLVAIAVVVIVLLAGALYYTATPKAVAPVEQTGLSTTTLETQGTVTPVSPTAKTPSTGVTPTPTNGGPGSQNIAPTLTGPGWTWKHTEHANGTHTTPKDPSRFVLTFENNGNAHSTTDCNGVSTNYTTNGNTMTFAAFMSTLMFCTNDSQEEVYRTDLAQVHSYSIVSGELNLTLKDGSQMTFYRPLKINQ